MNTLQIRVAQASTYNITPGINWKTQAPGGNGYWQSAYSSTLGIYVAVGFSNNIIISSDGISWTVPERPSSEPTVGVAWNGTEFLIVTSGGGIKKSTNGYAWTKYTSGLNLNRVLWDGTQYVAVGGVTTAVIATSPTGQTWTTRFSGSSTQQQSVANSASVYVSVGDTGVILRSADSGVTWAPQTSGVTVQLFSVMWSSVHSLFIVLGASGTILTSSDGVAWTPATSGTTQWLNGIAFNGTTYIVTGNAGCILTSTNGTTWALQTPVTTLNLGCIVFGGGKFVVHGRDSSLGNGGVIMSSTNGSSWTISVPGWAYKYQPIYVNSLGIYIATGNGGTIATSTDLKVWTAKTTGTSVSLYNPRWNGSTFVVVGQTARVLTSPTGETWTTRTSNAGTDTLFCPVWDSTQSIWCVVGGTGRIITSTDSINWTSRTSNTTSSLNAVASNGSIFVAVGDGGRIVTSTNPVNPWTVQTSNTAQSLYAILWTGTQFVAAGESIVVTSPDGINWTTRAGGSTNGWRGLAWNGQLLVAADYSGNIKYSSDGVSWGSSASSTTMELSGIGTKGSNFFAVGNYGLVLSSV